jgi:hypothetical protein
MFKKKRKKEKKSNQRPSYLKGVATKATLSQVKPYPDLLLKERDV